MSVRVVVGGVALFVAAALGTGGQLLNFLTERGATARYVTAVCTGSIVLGAAGLLDGYQATTHWTHLGLLELFGSPPREDRVVIDRNRITGGGVTAGIDFGLTVLERLQGRHVAEVAKVEIEDRALPAPQGSPRGHPRHLREVRRMLFTGLRREGHMTDTLGQQNHCMQCTMELRACVVVSQLGLVSDAAMAALVSAAGPPRAVRLLVNTASAGCGCGEPHGHSLQLVALEPADAAVPRCQRDAVAAVGPGVAVGDLRWPQLLGGTVALTGIDVRVDRLADLSGGGNTGPLLVSLGDLAASLAATPPGHVPELRTLVVLEEPVPAHLDPGWRREPHRGPAVPVTTGLAIEPATHVCDPEVVVA